MFDDFVNFNNSDSISASPGNGICCGNGNNKFLFDVGGPPLPLSAVGAEPGEDDFGDFLFFFEILGVVGGGMFNRLIEGDGFFK